MTTSEINALTDNGDIEIQGASVGPLTDRTFVAKDLFDIAGYPTGGGNPDWARTHPIPEEHSWAVSALLAAGATFKGKTITDEISLGILGENVFYGTPLNSAAPERVPGGSSSGSAAAVAAGLADIALGTDTGGSVRVPASFCGLYGIRPTHGRLNLAGMLPQAPSSDTTGWLARETQSFADASSVMLEEDIEITRPDRLVIAVDAFGFADRDTATALGPLVGKLSRLADETVEDVLAPQGISVWGKAQRTLQMAEAWQTFKGWIDATNPGFAFNVARGLNMGSMVSETDRQWAALMKREARARLEYLLPAGTVMVLPTTPFPAPFKGLPISEQNPVRELILSLCAHGGLAGFPQVSVPGAIVDGAPVGLSIVAARNEDARLVGLACALGDTLS
ncbi:amidase [Sneathiella marina]|uniref:Amidase n=1 Tax=Sneathiella marina TaxID=2950108 RepID=A0ABY4W829_9PROT|nr:amidase [Sneathiella marina]USG61915.1 amidase [Sneathiella marina]